MEKLQRQPGPRLHAKKQNRDNHDSTRPKLFQQVESKQCEERELSLGVVDAMEGPKQARMLKSMDPISIEIHGQKVEGQGQIGRHSVPQMSVEQCQTSP